MVREHANAVTDVGAEAVEPCHDAGGPHLFSRTSETAKMAPRLACGVFRSPAAPQVGVRSRVEMKAELGVEVAREFVFTPAIAQTAEPGHGQACFSTRPTALASRVQCASSSARRRRPFAVIS